MTGPLRPAPARPGLPAGWGVRLDPGLRRLDGDRVLVGGHPTRVLRLSPAGASAVTGWGRGEAVGPSSSERRLARRLVDVGAAHPRPIPGTGRRTTVALVVPTRGDASRLSALLAGALNPGFAAAGTLALPVSVVIVDDGSPDPDAVAGVAHRFGATLLRHEERRGPAAARNRGWRAVDTQAVAFLDDDCRCPQGPGWLAPLLDHLGDPTVALAAPRVRARRGAAPAWLAAYEGVASPLDMGGRPGPIRPGAPVPYVPAAALVVRRDALEQVGGFDESLHLGEDVDIEWRLAEAGWSLRYEPAALVDHDVRPDLPAWARQRARYGSSTVALDERHPGDVAPLRLSAWTGAALALAATTTPAGVAAGAVIAAGSTAALATRLGALPSPTRQAAALTAEGYRWTARASARAARREWWPLLVLGLLTRPGRRLGMAVAVTAAVRAARRSPPGLGRWRFLALALADDVAYGTGVWWEAIRRGRFAALSPALGGGPLTGRRRGTGPARPGGSTEEPLDGGTSIGSHTTSST